MRKVIWTLLALVSLAMAINQSTVSYAQYFDAEAWAVQAILATSAAAFAVGCVLRVASSKRKTEGDISFLSHAIAIALFASATLFWVAFLSTFLRVSLRMPSEARTVYSVIYFGTMAVWSFCSIQVIDRVLRKAADQLGLLQKPDRHQ